MSSRHPDLKACPNRALLTEAGCFTSQGNYWESPCLRPGSQAPGEVFISGKGAGTLGAHSPSPWPVPPHTGPSAGQGRSVLQGARLDLLWFLIRGREGGIRSTVGSAHSTEDRTTADGVRGLSAELSKLKLSGRRKWQVPRGLRQGHPCGLGMASLRITLGSI